ncbi:MAG: hypothetical protein DMF61_10955 [Blastocatellia bacterium AA13]|nr:MAG: hypothetical protein DMF61_10955 [Blastocatellia bacterium AA13]
MTASSCEFLHGLFIFRLGMKTSPSARDIEAAQRVSLWLDGHDAITTAAEAKKFLKSVSIALRYGATEGLPLASIYAAVHVPRESAAKNRETQKEREQDRELLRRAIELTNGLMAYREGIEINVIADRLVLAHRDLLPAIYFLRRRGRRLDDTANLSAEAKRALALLKQKLIATAGEVRSHLRLERGERHDPVVEALSELQREMLLDRGPSDVPKTGIPYLSRDGYPYRIFHEVHRDLVAKAGKLTVKAAADLVIGRYLKGAVYASPRKLASMFKLFLSAEEIDESVERLSAKKAVKLDRVGRTEVVVSR